MGGIDRIVKGMPYQIDVNRLKEAFPVPELKEGRLILHGELEEIVRSLRKTQRYYGVVNSWIKEMRNANGIYIVWDFGQGVKVLDPAGVLDHAETRTKQKIQQTIRAVKIYGWVDRSRLDQTGQSRYDHQARVMQAIEEDMRKARKNMAVGLAPIKSLPKRIA